MPTVTFTPDHVRTYQASVDQESFDDHTIRFGFGPVGAMTTVTVVPDGGPNSFGLFGARWNSPAVAGDGIALWTGFMALRYILGYFSQWELLPTALRHQARHPTAASVTPPRAVVAAVRGWEPGWERQLDPLCAANRPPAGAREAGGLAAE